MKQRLEFMNATERKIAEKLNTLTNINTFWDDVRKFTAKITSDRTIHKWECLSEIRFDELRTGVEDVQSEVHYGRPTQYYTYDWQTEVFIKEA